MKGLIVTKVALLFAVSGSLTAFATPQQSTTPEQFKAQYLERFHDFRASYLNRWEEYHAQVVEVWGDQTLLSTNHAFISYTEDMDERSIVDFENNTISLDKVVSGESQGPSHDELIRLLYRFSESSIDEVAKNDPILSLPESGNEQTLLGAFASGKTVDELLANAEIVTESIPIVEAAPAASTAKSEPPLATEPVAQPKVKENPVPPTEPKVVLQTEPEETNTVQSSPEKYIQRVTLRLSDDAIFSSRAEPFLPSIERLSEKYDIPADLILAITQVESAFNPLAQSPIPAFGLMQIVPSSAGLDVNRMVFNLNQPPKEDELFQSDFNLEFGTAYLNILYRNYLRQIEDPLSRFYSTIAAYNTGAGNVARAFHPAGKRSLAEAIPVINRLTSEEVYEQLLENLPYQETKDYLPKVVGAQERYTQI